LCYEFQVKKSKNIYKDVSEKKVCNIEKLNEFIVICIWETDPNNKHVDTLADQFVTNLKMGIESCSSVIRKNKNIVSKPWFKNNTYLLHLWRQKNSSWELKKCIH
jgi:hypothetical protein